MESIFVTLGALGAWLAALGLLALILLGLLMPLAVFGIKPLLRALIEEQRKTNRLLARQGMRDQGLEVSEPAVAATTRDQSAPQTLHDFIQARDARPDAK